MHARRCYFLRGAFAEKAAHSLSRNAHKITDKQRKATNIYIIIISFKKDSQIPCYIFLGYAAAADVTTHGTGTIRTGTPAVRTEDTAVAAADRRAVPRRNTTPAKGGILAEKCRPRLLHLQPGKRPTTRPTKNRTPSPKQWPCPSTTTRDGTQARIPDLLDILTTAKSARAAAAAK